MVRRSSVIWQRNSLLTLNRPTTLPTPHTLLAQEPVEGGIEFVHVGVLDAQAAGQRGVVPVPGGGPLGGGFQESGHDHGHHQLALPARSGGQHPVEVELAQAAEHGQHVAVCQAAFDGELVIESADGLAAEDGADGLDGLDGKGGEVGEGAVLDLAAIAVGLSEQVRLVLAVALAGGRWPAVTETATARDRSVTEHDSAAGGEGPDT
jgi:hypothetical protein